MSSRREAGSAAVEVVLVTPAILLVLALLVAGGRLTSQQSALRGVAREAGRIAVTASTPDEAVAIAQERAMQIALGYGLDPAEVHVAVDPRTFARGSDVVVTATYAADLTGVPSFGLIPRSARIEARHVEPIDRHISR